MQVPRDPGVQLSLHRQWKPSVSRQGTSRMEGSVQETHVTHTCAGERCMGAYMKDLGRGVGLAQAGRHFFSMEEAGYTHCPQQLKLRVMLTMDVTMTVSVRHNPDPDPDADPDAEPDAHPQSAGDLE